MLTLDSSYWRSKQAQKIKISLSYLILNDQSLSFISDNYSTSVVSKNGVFLNLRVTASTCQDSRPCILVYDIVKNVRWAVKQDNAIIIVVYLIIFDPTEPALNHEDPLRTTWINIIIEDHSVGATLSSKGNISFKVCEDFVLFNMGASALNKKDSLRKVTKNFIFGYRNSSTFEGLNTRLSVSWNWRVFFNSSKIVPSSTKDTVLFVLFYIIKFYSWIAPQVILSNCYNTALYILSDLVHYYEGISWYDLDPIQTVGNLTSLNFCFVSLMNSYPNTVNMIYPRS